MVSEDYATRSIRDMARTLTRMVLNEEEPCREFTEGSGEADGYRHLTALADAGEINEAENRLYGLMETGGGEELEMALIFYSHLNEKSNDFLEAHDFSREEIKAGLEDAMREQGMAGMAEAFLAEF